MPHIDPNSTVLLIQGVPFDPTYENTIFFQAELDPVTGEVVHTGQEVQHAYFLAKPHIQLDKLTYTRRDRGYIRVQLPISTVYQYSYMAYQNTSFENKWFYAFIRKIEYVNNITTDIFFDMDILQTWHFDYTLHQCFIERQHNLTDAVGDNIIPEQMNIGDYVVNSNSYTHHGITPKIIVACTVKPGTTGFEDVEGHLYAGRQGGGYTYYSGVEFLVYPASSVNDINAFLVDLTNANKIDSVISIFMGCSEIFGRETGDISSPTSFADITASCGTSVDNVYHYYVDGYEVRNKKLMTYPFSFFQVSNYQGETADLRYEFFSNVNQIRLKRFGNATTKPAILIYPANYRGLALDFESIVTTECFPLCSFTNDTFKAWLAQNAGSLGISASLGVANVVMGTATMSATHGVHGGSQVMSGASQIGSLVGEAIDMARLPPTTHGNGNGDALYQAGLCGFGTYKVSIRRDIAARLDSYFDMYGYAQNRCGVPDRNARPCYTYVKTKDCNIEGSLPSDDKKEIEALYNKGIRWWNKNVTQIGNFDPYVNPNGVNVQPAS